MAKREEVGIVGLGKFGTAMGEHLLGLGHRILGVDRSDAKVRSVQNLLGQVFTADATDIEALRQLGFQDMSHVMVCVGHSMETSVLATMHLKELGVEQVWVKAVSEQHERVLTKLGADFVVFPERFVARQLAHRLAVPGLVNFLPLDKGVVLQEIKVDKWDGRTLRDLDLTNRHQLRVVAVQRAGERDYDYLLHADMILRKGDLVVAIGSQNTLTDIEP